MAKNGEQLEKSGKAALVPGLFILRRSPSLQFKVEQTLFLFIWSTCTLLPLLAGHWDRMVPVSGICP